MEGAQVALPYKISRVLRVSLCVLLPDAHVDLQHVDNALQDALQELRDTGMVASSRLATRDDITRLLGLEHVYELEHTYGVAAGRGMVRDTTSAVLSHHLNTAREEIEWGRC